MTDSEFRCAVRNGDITTLSQYPDLDVDNGYAICTATQLGHLDLVQYIWRRHDNRHRVIQLFMLACKAGHHEVLDFLIPHVKDFAYIHDKAITSAAARGHVEVVARLWHLTPKYLSKPYVARAAAITAARNGRESVVRYIMQAADPTLKTRFEACQMAALNGQVAVVQYLLQMHDTTPFSYEQQRQLVMHSVQSGNQALVLYLQQQNYPIHYVECMSTAIRHENLTMMIFLHQLLPSGHTYLHELVECAIAQKNLDIVYQLYAWGADFSTLCLSYVAEDLVPTIRKMQYLQSKRGLTLLAADVCRRHHNLDDIRDIIPESVVLALMRAEDRAEIPEHANPVFFHYF